MITKETTMTDKQSKTTAKKILDTVVISSLSSLVASIIGGVAFMVYMQAQTATNDIRDIKSHLEAIQKDIEKTNDAIISEIAPLKAEHATSDTRFDEIERFLQSNMGEFILPEPPTYSDIKQEEDDLKGQFNNIQQQAPIN